MEPEVETKPCSNCKREIPVLNVEMHALFCERNISACAVCKEPVPRAQMQQHHDAMHKLAPCKQCGESVCGTDLEDHIRDSCANTIKSCRFCSLELPRRSLPAHESFCGARTELCRDCEEYVMVKYLQLHLDSNHGFLRLDDDPVPRQSSKPIRTPVITSASSSKPLNTSSNSRTAQNSGPKTEIRYYDAQTGPSNAQPVASCSNQNAPSTSGSRAHNESNGAIAKADKSGSKSGSVKKRPAPRPPRSPPPSPARDHSYHSALRRAQEERRQREQQTAHNLALGLPPVLSAAEKLEKLRKMDALTHREMEPPDYRDKLRGRVWMTPQPIAGNIVGHARISPDDPENNNNIDYQNLEKATPDETPMDVDRPDEDEMEQRRREFKNLKPMSPQEFMTRFSELQLERNGERVEKQDGGRRNDRFSEIKSSLRELRRGLNEVTAPYNAGNAAGVQNNRNAALSPLVEDVGDVVEQEEVKIPCEFCTELIAVDDLVLHQTGCRPDLAQFRPSSSPSPPRSPLPPYPPSPPRYQEPVIPCEFCMKSLPVYLITEHQERCGRDANLLYPD